MKPSTRSSIRNVAVTVCLLGSAAFFSWMFWSELTRTVERTDGVLVGRVLGVIGQAQRRYDRQSYWTSIKGEELVYNLDAIRTVGDSNTTIILETFGESGESVVDELGMGADTYIILDLFGKSRNINFIGGDILAAGSQGLTVSAEGTVVSAGDGQVVLQRAEGEQTSVAVIEGEATVSRGGEQILVNTETVLTIDEATGEAVRERAVLTPGEPRSDALLLTYRDTRQVEFSWDLLADWSEPLLEVSANPAFPPADTISVPAVSPTAIALGERRWYWRLSDGSGGPYSPVYGFSVRVDGTASPLAPADRALIAYRGDAPSVPLRWTPADYADSYTLELSQSADFAGVPIRREVRNNFILIDELGDGEWWWRVTPNYRRGIIDSAPDPELSSFVLERRADYDPVRLLFPADEAIVRSGELSEELTFSWQRQDGIDSYRMSLSRDEAFASILEDTEGPGTRHRINLGASGLDPGVYYWRVEASSSDLAPVPPSAPRSFRIVPDTGGIQLVSPEPGESVTLDLAEPYTFEWRSEVPGTARVRVRRQSGQTSTALYDESIQGAAFTRSFPGEGTYAWQVQILDEGDRMLVESDSGEFTVRDSFSPPRLVSPSSGAGISLVGAIQVPLEWTAAENADAYRVILRSPDGRVAAREDRVLGLRRELVLPNWAGPGIYIAELAALRDNPPAGGSAASRTASFRFNVREVVRYTAAVPTSPANNAVIDAERALQSGVRLRWNQNPPLGNWTVELGSSAGVRRIQSTEPVLLLRELRPGRYTWKVVSRDNSGLAAPDSRSRSFTVSDYAVPSEPGPVFPALGEEVDMVGATGLLVRWRESRNADYYNLLLYRPGLTAPVYRASGIRSASYNIEDMDILSVGDFVMELTAYAEYPEAGVTRQSGTTRIPFSLSATIEAPTILTEEEQYADE